LILIDRLLRQRLEAATLLLGLSFAQCVYDLVTKGTRTKLSA
jgi:hypothetical protein